MPNLVVRAKACWIHAKRCRAAATVATQEHGREQFLDLAQHWESMAREIEELENLRRRLTVLKKTTIETSQP